MAQSSFLTAAACHFCNESWDKQNEKWEELKCNSKMNWMQKRERLKWNLQMIETQKGKNENAMVWWTKCKKRNNHNDYSSFYLVIRMGLEPMTPTLKVLCSTNWASESYQTFFSKASAKVLFFFDTAKLFAKFLFIFVSLPLCRTAYTFEQTSIRAIWNTAIQLYSCELSTLVSVFTSSSFVT